jgi:hypothetical protein
MNRLNKHETHWLVLVGALVIVALVVSACSVIGGGGGGGIGGGKDEGNPLPTPRPAEDVGAESQSAAKDTPEGTWESYLRDIVAEQVSQRGSLISLYERYQNPDITSQNLGGMVQDVDLVEDRTEFSMSGNSASAWTDFDVRVAFANGDTDTRTCHFTVAMEFDEEDGVWYVVNPEPLAIFAVCSP